MVSNNEYIKQIIEKPKVEEVREIEEKEIITPEERAKIVDYFKERQDLIIKKSKLSPAARSKIIKKHGSDYLSERAFVNDIALMQTYGPGFWNDIGELGGFVCKAVATTAVAGAVIASAGTAAPLVGAGMWLGGKAVEEIGKDTDIQALRSIGSFTKDVGFGSMTTLALKDVKFISDCASMGIDIKKLNKIKD